MLDDLKYIHSFDKSDALGFAAKQPQQLLQTYAETESWEPFSIDNIVFAGMGGSSLWALMSLTWPGYTVPFEIWRRYNLPTYVSEKTLVIANSYSGSTEETLSAVAAAESAGAHIVSVARGGKLIEIAKENNRPFITLPDTLQPRLGTFSGFASLLAIASHYNLTKLSVDQSSLTAAVDFLETEQATWAPDVPTKDNPAKQLALEVAGTAPIIYSGQEMLPAAYKWKIGFNEAAKNISWYGEIPEFSHNEFLGWTSHPIDKPYSVIDLRSQFEHPQVTKRFEITERLLSGKRPHPHTITAKGSTVLEEMLQLMLFGDFVSIYVGLLNGQDPSDFGPVDALKKALTN